MNKKIYIGILFAATIIVTVFATYFLFKPVTLKPLKRIYFGFELRLGASEQIKLYQPFMDYLSKETGYSFRMLLSDTYRSNRENLGLGRVSFAAIGGLGFVKAQRNYGVNMLARGLNVEKVASYRSVIFTSPDSDISRLADVEGRRFAFGSKSSTQGHLIPRKMLEREGISLKDLESYTYTGSHQNAVNAVLEGRADVGAAQDTLVMALARQKKIMIMKISKYYPSSGIAYNKDVDPEVILKVKKALLNFDPHGRHKETMPNWNRTEMAEGFVEATLSDFLPIYDLAHEYGLLEPSSQVKGDR